MRVMISGASGLLGTALTRGLQSDGHETVALVRRTIPEELIPVLEGEAEEDAAKIFGEELPSGLVMAEVV